MWLGFRLGNPPSDVRLNKWGTEFSAHDVVTDGGMLHAVDQVTVLGDTPLRLTPIDSPLICPEGPRLSADAAQLTPSADYGRTIEYWLVHNFSPWTEGAMASVITWACCLINTKYASVNSQVV